MRANSRSFTCAVLLLGLSFGAAGCASPIGVTRWSPEQAAQQSYANALSSDHPTSFTIQTLLRLGLYEKFKDDPASALAELHKGLAPTGHESRLFTLAELSLLHARKTESQPHFLAAALYAYAFIVPEAGAKPPLPPGKIPVVLVHGTASSPARWAELFNEIDADPRLANRYQFWLFTYNTGNPILISSGILRKSRARAVGEFDPEGKDPALRRMVVH